MFKPNRTAVRRRLPNLLLGCLAAGVLVAQAASSVAPVFVSNAQVISTGAPAYELDVTTTTTETVDVTLADLSASSSSLTALQSVTLLVTSSGATVDAASASSPALLTAPGKVSIAATANTTYQILVVGVPASGAAQGNAVAVQVTSHATGATYKYGSHSFVLPTVTVPQTVYAGSTPFTVTASGAYTITLNDLAAPAPLSGLLGLVLGDAPGSQAIPILDPATHATTTTATLAAGTYKVFVAAGANAGTEAGLFGITVAGGGSSPLLDVAVPVGVVRSAHADLTASGQTLSLSATDLLEPTALSALDFIVTSGSQLVGQAGAGQTVPVTAPTGTVSFWLVATPAAGGAGAYSVGAAPLLAATTSVVADPAGTLHPYAVTIPSAGSYVPTVKDEVFPAAFNSLSYQLYQGGTQLGSGNGGGAGAALSLQPGTAVLVTNAVPNAAGNGIYSAALSPAAGGAATFATVQAVGSNLTAVPFTVTSSGVYDFVLQDLAWPASFSAINGLISQAASVQSAGFPAKIYGSGTLPGLTLPAGNYVATLNGVPATGQVAGAYSVSLVPSVPTVTLTASPTAINTGSGTTLTWSSTGATGCTGATSGVAPAFTHFVGAQAPTGTLNDGPFTSAGTATYTLSCTGPGGSASATATVTVAGTSNSGGSSGGGASGGVELAGLALLALLRRRGRLGAVKQLS